MCTWYSIHLMCPSSLQIQSVTLNASLFNLLSELTSDNSQKHPLIAKCHGRSLLRNEFEVASLHNISCCKCSCVLRHFYTGLGVTVSVQCILRCHVQRLLRNTNQSVMFVAMVEESQDLRWLLLAAGLITDICLLSSTCGLIAAGLLGCLSTAGLPRYTHISLLLDSWAIPTSLCCSTLGLYAHLSAVGLLGYTHISLPLDTWAIRTSLYCWTSWFASRLSVWQMKTRDLLMTPGRVSLTL